ncbi:hypothetical protein F5Y03DRAFT_401829 [Xylaria venustula]|nr:hypothetical protein F5Y03DRAFT_401829 [Xylaria venustula]
MSGRVLDTEVDREMEEAQMAESYQLQIHGKAANVAQGNVNVDQQFNDMKKNYENQQRIYIYMNQPKEDPARYIEFSQPNGLGPEIAYDMRYRSHVQTKDSVLLSNKIHASWEKISSVESDLRASIDKFDREVLKRGAKCSENLSSLHESFEGAVIWFDSMLKIANRASSTVRVGKRVTVAFVNVKQYIPSFFDWFLEIDPFGCLISAVANGIDVDSRIILSLGEIVQYFDHAADYRELCKSKGLSPDLHDATVDLFAYVAGSLKKLLEHAWRGSRLTTQQRNENAERLSKLKSKLEEMNVESRIVNDPFRRPQRPPNNAEGSRIDLLWNWQRFFTSTRSLGAPDLIGSSTHAKTKKPEIVGLSPVDLAVHLGYDPKLLKADIAEIGTPGFLEETQLSQVAAVTRRDEFKKWLREDRKAKALLIHGNFEDNFEMSPLSHLCASFPQVYQQKSHEAIIFLHYFCRGRKYPRRRYHTSATDIVKSFIGQLLTNRKLASCFNLSFVDGRSIRRIRQGNFEDVCKLFLRLLIQLAREEIIVFCFIDSISDCEVRGLYKDTECLLSTLRDRQWKKVPGARMLFKLLITDAQATRYAHKYFTGRGELINMNEEDDHDDDALLDLD